MKDNAQNFMNQSAEYTIEIEKLKNTISDLRKIATAAVDAAKRAEELKDSTNFYRI
jgi:hypothetical protein